MESIGTIIKESGMDFGPFQDEHCFYIEKSKIYAAIQDGVPMAEFLLWRMNKKSRPTIWIVEAKSSSPRPQTIRFKEYIGEIREKLKNALLLYIAICMRRHSPAEDELPKLFKDATLSTLDFCLVLVINGHKDEWLPPLKDSLYKELKSTIKTLGLSDIHSVKVLNDVLAKEMGLIRESAQNPVEDG
jgi:hypothetical protein